MAKYLDLDGLTRYNNKVNAKLDTKADVDGNYEDMAVGQLLSNTFEEDKAPYNFRTSGGALEIGDREYDTLVGGSVAFNQLVQNGNFASTTGWGATNGISISATNNELTVSVDSDPSDLMRVQGTVPETIIDHIYLQKVDAKSSQANIMRMYCPADGSTTIFNLTTAYSSCYIIAKAAGNRTPIQPFRLNTGDTKPVGSTYTLKNCNFIDLTQMFGSTIADYIYSLEQATTGSGVAYFRSLFPKDYYAYNAGQLMSVKALSHKMVGFNQWDEEWELGTLDDTTGAPISSNTATRSKNYNNCVCSQEYYVKSDTRVDICWYDSDHNYISKTKNAQSATKTAPNNARYFKLCFPNSTSPSNICINLHWDGERDGEYEAYEEHIYPLDSDLELRGIPKLDANNQLYYDGDTYESDGTVTRKYGIVDLGTLAWQKIGAGSDKHRFSAYNELMKPSTLQIMCSNYPRSSSTYGGIFGIQSSNNNIYIFDWAYEEASATEFKQAMSGVYLVYELATPTTETADTFENPQLVDNWGTEEYTDSREVQIPVGHITKYPPDLKAKLESAPDSPASDGDYILRHNNGENSYVALTKELPAVPTTDGTYVFKATVSGGVTTLSWVAEE